MREVINEGPAAPANVERKLDPTVRLRHRRGEIVGHGDRSHGGAELRTPYARHRVPVYEHAGTRRQPRSGSTAEDRTDGRRPPPHTALCGRRPVGVQAIGAGAPAPRLTSRRRDHADRRRRPRHCALRRRPKRETIRKSLAALAQILDFAGVKDNPARDRSRVRLPRELREEPTAPTAAQIEAVLGVVPPRYALALLVLDATGVRVGELEETGLLCGDLDEPNTRWRIRRAVEVACGSALALGDSGRLHARVVG
jgi:integrase